MGLRFEEDPNATNTRALEAEIKEMVTSNQANRSKSSQPKDHPTEDSNKRGIEKGSQIFS